MSPAWVEPAHWACVAVFAGVCGVVVHRLATHPPGLVARWLAAHHEALRRRLVALRWPVSATQVMVLQASLVLAGLGAGVFVAPALGAVLACLPGLVTPLLDARLTERLAQMDMQLEPWLRALAGGLSSGASLGQALQESQQLIDAPLRQEVAQACREISLGASVSEGLRRMAARVDSATLATAVAAIRIGQRSGGGLPRTLRESASALREMARLEGVVRTRTAEARAQATVVGIIPPPMVAFIHHIDPNLMSPLWKHPDGWMVVTLAVVLWVVSILVARRILDVDV